MSRTWAPVHRGGELTIFDGKPIELDGFRLTGEAAVPVGKPTPKQWVTATRFAASSLYSSPYWIGDLLAYAEDREDWREKFDQMLSLTGLARGTLHNHTTVSRKVEVPERRLARSWSHARIVSRLERPLQTQLLTQAREQRWTSSHLAGKVREQTQPLVLEGQAVLEGVYRVILAAPPWRKMSIAAIAGLPVQLHAAAESVLFLYTPARLVGAAPGMREVLDGWGFTYQTHGVWDRVQDAGAGRFLNLTHEDIVIATRGDCRPDLGVDMPRSVFVERRPLDETYRKPEAIRREWIEKLFVRGPYLELFGLAPVEGWSVFGADPGHWSTEAATYADRLADSVP